MEFVAFQRQPNFLCFNVQTYHVEVVFKSFNATATEGEL